MSDIIPSKTGTGDGYQGDNSGRRQVIRQKSTVEYTNTFGPTGPQGEGPQGFQGRNGATGLVGQFGNQSAFGFQGVQGYEGLENKGFVGLAGTFGAQSEQGPQGSQGFGVQGFQGSGLQGNQGFSGGIQGERGFKGFVGSQGVQGIQGASGVQGPQGFQGPQGQSGFSSFVQGPISSRGPDGPPGSANGFQGFQGTQGTPIVGFQGPQGYQGPQGDPNIDGIQGPQAKGVLPFFFEERSTFYDDYLGGIVALPSTIYGLTNVEVVEGAFNGVVKVSTFSELIGGTAPSAYNGHLLYGATSLASDYEQVFKTSICFDSPRGDDKIVLVGFMGPFVRARSNDSITDIEHGSFFKYDPEFNAGRWTIANYDNNSISELPTNISPTLIGGSGAAGLEFQHIEIRRELNSVDFYLNSSLVGSISENIPQFSRLYFGVYLVNKFDVERVPESVYIDYISMSRLRS